MMDAITKKIETVLVKTTQEDASACGAAAAVLAELVCDPEEPNATLGDVDTVSLALESSGMVVDDDMVDVVAAALEARTALSTLVAKEQARAAAEAAHAAMAVGDVVLALLEEDQAWHLATVVEIPRDRNKNANDDGGGETEVEKKTKEEEEEAGSGSGLSSLVVEFMQYGKRQRVDADQIVTQDAALAVEEDAYEGNNGELHGGSCELCERVMMLTRHHLRPRMVHQRYIKKGYSRNELALCTDICRPCHNVVHRAEDEATLAEHWYTADLLKTHPVIIKWIEYARNARIPAQYRC